MVALFCWDVHSQHASLLAGAFLAAAAGSIFLLGVHGSASHPAELRMAPQQGSSSTSNPPPSTVHHADNLGLFSHPQELGRTGVGEPKGKGGVSPAAVF